MTNFTIRVLLEAEADEDDYARLDSVMKRSEIQNTITSELGKKYQLPPGEYSYSGEIDRKSLLEKVKAAAGELAKPYSVLITESRGRTWYNLDRRDE
ncbi:hypothetical protein [Herbaspirillum huttiense]|uniref:hypothetical protein n=1 Tax=Herbaspirillum huttiense TaxID=863372 RepID=UPI0031E445E2